MSKKSSHATVLLRNPLFINTTLLVSTFLTTTPPPPHPLPQYICLNT